MRGSESTSHSVRWRRWSVASATSSLLVATLARVREERTPQLITIVGVPGIGKSRLVFELFARRRG